MKSSHQNIVMVLVIVVGLLAACSTTNVPEATATPKPTATLIPPTPTPSAADILVGGWQAFEEGDLETARDITEQVMAQFPEDGETHALFGVMEADQGNLILAIEQFETAIEKGYQDQDTLTLLSETYLQRSSQIIDEIFSTWQFDEIQDLILEARDYLEQNKDLGFADDPRAEALTAWFNRPMEDAFESLEPNSMAEASIIAAYDYMEAENLDAAIAELERAIQNDPDLPILYSLIATLYVQNHDYLKAIESAQMAIDLNPNLYQEWTDMGFAYIYLSLPLHAREAFVNSMLADPTLDLAKEGLNGLRLTFATWDDTYLLEYGFRISFPPDGEYGEVPNLMENSAEEGVAGYAGNNTLVFLRWMPLVDSGYDPTAIVKDLPEGIKQIGTTQIVGEPLLFEYNQIPITYQPYILTPTGKPEYASISIYATWKCGNTIYTFNQQLAEGDMDYLFMINPFLESVTCGVESYIPDHP
jgi:tetratricopeptide (TPR) repeat protein